MRKNASREAKNGPAGLKSEPGGTKAGPPGAYFTHFGGTFAWGIPLRIFTHFYKVFMNICAFLLKIHGKPTKIQQNDPKVTNTARKHRKID